MHYALQNIWCNDLTLYQPVKVPSFKHGIEQFGKHNSLHSLICDRAWTLKVQKNTEEYLSEILSIHVPELGQAYPELKEKIFGYWLRILKTKSSCPWCRFIAHVNHQKCYMNCQLSILFVICYK